MKWRFRKWQDSPPFLEYEHGNRVLPYLVHEVCAWRLSEVGQPTSEQRKLGILEFRQIEGEQDLPLEPFAEHPLELLFCEVGVGQGEGNAVKRQVPSGISWVFPLAGGRLPVVEFQSECRSECVANNATVHRYLLAISLRSGHADHAPERPS